MAWSWWRLSTGLVSSSFFSIISWSICFRYRPMISSKAYWCSSRDSHRSGNSTNSWIKDSLSKCETLWRNSSGLASVLLLEIFDLGVLLGQQDVRFVSGQFLILGAFLCVLKTGKIELHIGQLLSKLYIIKFIPDFTLHKIKD